MKALLYRWLLISTVILPLGCAGPDWNIGREERLLADGYPPEYVAGFKTGYESFCAERYADKSRPITNWEAEYCSSRNLEAKGKQEPRKSKSYQQGQEDGKQVAGRDFYNYRKNQLREMGQMAHSAVGMNYMQMPDLSQ